MTFNFYLVQVKPEAAKDFLTYANRPKRGLALIKFKDSKNSDELYDLRGLGKTELQFTNWAKKEFGYLNYTIIFG